MAMLALVAVIASDRLTITSASSDKHQVLAAGMTITSSRFRPAEDHQHQQWQTSIDLGCDEGHHKRQQR